MAEGNISIKSIIYYFMKQKTLQVQYIIYTYQPHKYIQISSFKCYLPNIMYMLRSLPSSK